MTCTSDGLDDPREALWDEVAAWNGARPRARSQIGRRLSVSCCRARTFPVHLTPVRPDVLPRRAGPVAVDLCRFILLKPGSDQRSTGAVILHGDHCGDNRRPVWAGQTVVQSGIDEEGRQPAQLGNFPALPWGGHSQDLYVRGRHRWVISRARVNARVVRTDGSDLETLHGQQHRPREAGQLNLFSELPPNVLLDLDLEPRGRCRTSKRSESESMRRGRSDENHSERSDA
jgi:hypothetical protein